MVRPWLGRFCFVFGSFLLFLSSLKCAASHAAGVFDVAFAEWRRLISQTWTCFVERFLQRFLQGCLFFLFFGGSFSFNGFLSFVFEGPRMDAGEIFFQQFPSSSRFVSITRSIDWKRRRRHLSIPLVVCFLWRTRSFSSLVFCSFLKKRRNPNEKKRKSPHFFFMDRTRAKNETSDNRRTLFTNSSPTPSKEGRPLLVARPFFWGGGIFLYLPDITWNAIDLMRVESNNVFGCTTCSRSIQSSFISNSCSSFDFTLLPDAKVR